MLTLRKKFLYIIFAQGAFINFLAQCSLSELPREIQVIGNSNEVSLPRNIRALGKSDEDLILAKNEKAFILKPTTSRLVPSVAKPREFKVQDALESNKEKIQLLKKDVEELMRLFNELKERKFFGVNLSDEQRTEVEKCSKMVKMIVSLRLQELIAEKTVRNVELQTNFFNHTNEPTIVINILKTIMEGILNDLVESVKSKTSNGNKIIRLSIKVSKFLLKNHMLVLREDSLILYQPRFLKGLGDLIFEKFCEYGDFDPLFLSLDLEDYILKHPRMADYLSIFSNVKGMRRKQIFESFLINKLPKIYPIVSVFSKKHQNKVLEEILVPEIGALMEEFALDVPPFEILNQVGHRDFFEKLEGDCFFRHKLIYHSIKLAFRYEPEKFDKRMIRQTLVFEETLKMVISKMEMIQLMAYSGLEYNPTWRGPVMDMIKNINRKLHRGKYARESLDMSSFKKSVTKKFQDREILKIWPAWRDELIRAKNSVEEQNKKYNDFIDSIEPGGDQYEIENTWKNSRLIAGIRGEFQASVRPEIKVLELMEAMDNWMIEIKNRPETKKSLRDRVISYFTSS